MLLCSSGNALKFFDSQSGICLTYHWRVATIGFPDEEKNKCSLGKCWFLGQLKVDERRAIGDHYAMGVGAVVVKDKTPQRPIALEDGGNGKSSLDADDALANEAWEVDVLLGVVGGSGSGNSHQVGLLKKLLIRPDANDACGGDAGRDEKESSGEKDQANSFPEVDHVFHLKFLGLPQNSWVRKGGLERED